MCGIVGYIGDEDSICHLLSGLERLEYRGYDSAGIAIIKNNEVSICKTEGRLEHLKKKLKSSPTSSKTGIGHTRWATHGEPSVYNSHPHSNANETIAVVHNGIIENYAEIKNDLIEKGYNFKSETDSEVIPHLLDYYYEGDFSTAFHKTIKRLRGSYAIGVISSFEPDKIFAVRKDSPLVVGISSEGNYIASDIPAIIDKTRDLYLLEDNEFVILTKDSVFISDEYGNEIKKNIYNVTFTAQESQKDGYEHFMLKEIHEQTSAIKNTISGYIDENLRLNFNNIKFSDNIKKLYIVACGTAYHAGLVGKKAIEILAKLPCEVHLASEFRYAEPLIDDTTAVLVVSQSGETADTLAVLRMAKQLGNTVYAITNVLGSSVSREADYVLYTYAGPEISVASTKAYTTQLAVFYLFAIYLAEQRKSISKELLDSFKTQIHNISKDTLEALNLEEKIKSIAQKISKERDIYFLGRGLDYFTCLEASLKLKEISYIHSDAYASGELKHGPIALIEDETIVVSISTNPEINSKVISNLKEANSRGAKIIGFTSCDSEQSVYDEVICIPKVNPLLSPLIAIIPMQLLAYYVSVNKGLDVDKPRNLAKSVTVE